MPARAPRSEADPIATPAVASEAATRAAADAVEASARAAADATKQDASTAATDTELAAEASARAAADSAKQDAATAATDVELAGEASARTSADALKQDASTAATDLELAGEASARDAAIATHAGLKRGVHGIPGSVGSGQAIVGDGSGGWSAADVATQAELDAHAAVHLEGISTVDVCGESIGVGVGASNTDQNNFVDRLAGMLGGVKVRRNFSIGGAVACWHTNNATIGQPGWGWFIGYQGLHGLYPRQGWAAPYYPLRDLGIVKYGLNDLAALGSAKPRPFQEALRNLISAMLACNGVQTTDASWAFTGTWTALNTFGAAAGPIGTANYRSTVTVGDKAVLTLPASFPAGQTLALTVTVNPTYDYTLGVKINGVAQADVPVNGAAICDSAAAVTELNQLCLRFAGRAAGDTVELSLKARTAGNLLVDEARVEAADADAPIVLLPSLHTPTDFTFWSSANWAHGNGAGSDPINAAGVTAFNSAMQTVVAEFGPSVRYVDIDTVIGANGAANTLADGVHPNDTGYALAANKLYDTIATSGLATASRQSRVSRVSGFHGTAVIGAPSWPGLNSWAAPVEPHLPLSYYKDVTGRVWIGGAVSGGSSATASIFQLPAGYRPGRDIRAFGSSSAATPVLQTWKIAADGTLNIIAGGDTTRSTLSMTSFMPAG